MMAGAALASRWPVTSDQTPASLEWVRTVDGWERSAHLIPVAEHGPTMHPLTLAALQVLAAGVALAAGWSAAAASEDDLAAKPAAAISQRRRAKAPRGAAQAG
ncbi:hypothetical protein Pla123a_02430 [Posidoniimonas polymericola]|uniref:Uncharacterized protein n=2 Tax=Posidoniimonas polymericola TaxID=2528002 RepID=A0A5C5ZE59_9BACT|nr:hypothetical protein Pla123a_02430 [Posidoniimonas polymericola]